MHHRSLLLIIALILLAYSNSFSNQFVFDDISHIILNKYIHHLGNVFERSPDNILYARPLANISLAIDYQLWGKNPFGYHITNTLLHLTNAILLYWIVIRLWGIPSLAISAGLLFSLHPVNTEALAMIALGRAYLLSALFSLLSWLFYLRWHSDSHRWRRISITGFISCWFLAITANELGFILPIFLLAVDLLRSDKRNRANLLILMVFTPLFLFILPSLNGALDPLLGPKETIRLSIVPFLMGRYIKLLIHPFGLSAWYEGMQIPIWPDPEIILSIGIIALVILSIPFLNRYDKRLAFSLGLLLYHLFVISLRAINNPPSLMGERWLYMGSIGFSLSLALAIERISEINMTRNDRLLKTGLVTLFSGLIIIYGLLTFMRNQDWKDEHRFWSSTVKMAPNSARVHYNLGYAAHKKGYIAQAEEEYNKAVMMSPLLEEAHNNLGVLYMNRGETENAIKEFKKVIEINPRYSEAHNNLGILYAGKGILDFAEDELKQAIMIDPENPRAHYNLGIIYKENGLFDKTISELNRAIQIDPEYKAAHKALEETYQITKENRK